MVAKLRSGPAVSFFRLSSQGIPIYQMASPNGSIESLGVKEAERLEKQLLSLPTQERNRAWEGLSPRFALLSLNEAGFLASELLYKRSGKDREEKIWFKYSKIARGARERKNLMSQLLLSILLNLINCRNGERLRLLSLGSGSGRIVIRILPSLLEVDTVAYLVDWNEAANAFSLELANTAKVSHMVQTIEADVVGTKTYLGRNGFVANVVEASDIFDYFEDRVVKYILREIFCHLGKGGVVLASNILPSKEIEEFYHTVVGWRPMHYRSEDHFAQLFIDSGFFDVANIRVYRAGLGLHCIVRAIR